MKKVAIVGVEGSGKTVLMAAMGDQYESPDANGIFLRPMNRRTFAYYTREVANLRNGQWPMATESGVLELDWMLMRQSASSERQESLGQLSFLDFGGEIYRRAFGDRGQNELNNDDGQRKSAVKQLKAHVQNADTLIVLVNLSDIINGSNTDEQTIEMRWLSQSILSLAYAQKTIKDVALVFTQADTYSETITASGGLRGTLARYLPVVNTNYGNKLQLFQVAAVNKTIPSSDDSARLMPLPNFSSSGLDDLMAWVVERVNCSMKSRGRGDKARKILRCLLSYLLFMFILFLIGMKVTDMRDKREWFERYRIGAEQGAADAQRELGDCYYDGYGVKRDIVEAEKWYRKAAEQGDLSAQMELESKYGIKWRAPIGR